MPHGAIPFPFGDCRICNDKATGVHYGVATCEGCKGFYKRSIPKGDKYRCYFGGACVISPQNRNRCKACRFRRCLDQGMAVEAVKMGRIPKIQKDKALEEAASQKKEKTTYDLSDTHHSLPKDPSYNEFAERQEKTARVYKRKHSFGIKVESSGSDGSDGSYVDDKQDAGVLGSSVQGTGVGNCKEEFHPHAVQNQGTCPVVSDPPNHAWEIPEQFSLHPHHQGKVSVETKDKIGEGEDSCLPLAPDLLLPFPNMPVKQEHMPSSQEMPECYGEMPAESAQRNVLRQGMEEQMMGNENVVPGCPDKSGICGTAGSTVKRLNGPLLNGNDGRFSPGFGGKLRNYSPGLIEVLFNQMVESENGDIERAKEKLLKRLASTLGQERNLSSFEASSATATGATVLPETSQPQSRLMSDMDYSGKAHCSISNNLETPENSGTSFSSAVFSPPYTLSQEWALAGQQAQWHGPRVSDCTGEVCPAEDFMSFPSQSRSFSEDYLTLNRCKDDLLRDTDEVLSFDSNSSVSSGEHLSVPDDACWEETIQKLEKSFVLKFQFLKNRQEARDKVLKQKQAGSFSIPQQNDMDLLWMSLMRSLRQHNESIIGFCKDVPGFVALNHADQEVLLKYAYYDIWILTQSEFFVDGESYLILDDGTFYTRALMHQVVGKEVTDAFHKFAQQFNALSLSQLEIAVVCCIQLTTAPKDQNLTRPEDIQKLNSFYLDLLVHLVNRSHGAASSRVLVDIFRLVPLLAEVNRLQREVIGSLKVDNPSFKKPVLGQ